MNVYQITATMPNDIVVTRWCRTVRQRDTILSNMKKDDCFDTIAWKATHIPTNNKDEFIAWLNEREGAAPDEIPQRRTTV